MVPDPVTLCVTHTCGAPNFFQLEDTYACTVHAPGTGRGHHERSESRRRAAARSAEGPAPAKGTGPAGAPKPANHGTAPLKIKSPPQAETQAPPGVGPKAPGGIL